MLLVVGAIGGPTASPAWRQLADSWRKDGPVRNFFVPRFVPEYFQSAFERVGDAFRFVGGTLTPDSIAQFKAPLERLTAEFEKLARRLDPADRLFRCKYEL